jgi:putative copper resistance protein D
MGAAHGARTGRGVNPDGAASALALCLAVHAGALMFWGGGLALQRMPQLALFRVAPAALQGAGALALASALVWPLLQAAVVYDDTGAMLDAQRVLPMLGQTHFGRVWLGRTVLVALAFVLSWSSSRRAPRAVLALVAAALASLALVGHAAAIEGAAGWLQQGVLALHLLVAAAWVGALPALWRGARELPLAELARGLQRFSVVGLRLVGLVLATGLASAWWRSGSFAALASSAYGACLAAKVAMVALMGVVALRNRNRLTPDLAAAAAHGDADGGARGALAAPRRALRASLALEIGLGAAVVVLAAFLGAAEAPR